MPDSRLSKPQIVDRLTAVLRAAHPETHINRDGIKLTVLYPTAAQRRAIMALNAELRRKGSLFQVVVRERGAAVELVVRHLDE